MPALTKQALERRFSGAVAHDFGSLHSTKKPRRYLRGDIIPKKGCKSNTIFLLRQGSHNVKYVNIC